MNHSKPQDKKLRNQKGLVSQASRIALFLALLAAGLFFTTKPFSVEGKKLRAAQGEVQVQGVKVEGVTSAVVNFGELARQQALNPDVSIPHPGYFATETIVEVEGEAGEAEAQTWGPGDLPSPLIHPRSGHELRWTERHTVGPARTPFFTIHPIPLER